MDTNTTPTAATYEATTYAVTIRVCFDDLAGAQALAARLPKAINAKAGITSVCGGGEYGTVTIAAKIAATSGNEYNEAGVKRLRKAIIALGALGIVPVLEERYSDLPAAEAAEIVGL